MAIYNGFTALGRIVYGLGADKFGHINTFIFAMALNTILMFLWTIFTSQPTLIVFAVIDGVGITITFCNTMLTFLPKFT